MRVYIIGIVLLVITGCGVERMKKIDPGMSFLEVDTHMGRRDSFKSVIDHGEEFTLYQYTNQFCNWWVDEHEKCDFFVIFKDGKVVETGVKNVRDRKPNMQYLYMFNY